jgi:hypothetical protein
LCAHPEWIINIFISLGSPLGHRGLVFDRLSPAPSNNRGVWPGQTRNWVNVADRGDIVATNKYLSSLFGPDVIDLSVHNGSHAHDILPYLTASEVGATISHGLGNNADDKTLLNSGNITVRLARTVLAQQNDQRTESRRYMGLRSSVVLRDNRAAAKCSNYTGRHRPDANGKVL